MFFRNDCFAARFQPVIVDRLGGAVQELGNLHAIADAEAYQSVDTKFGVQQFSLFGYDLFVGL